MKPNSTTPASESNRTVLMVDGHGHIRTIRKFHQKLWIGIAVMACCVLLAVGAGWLYVGGLQTQQELRARIDNLRTQLAEVEHQKELLLARAVKAESRITTGESARAPAPAKDDSVPPPSTAKNERLAAPTAAPKVTAQKKKASPPSPPAPAAAPPPVVSVDVDKLKVDYDRAAKALSAGFVVRNTGNRQAQGRAVVVLSSSSGEGTPRLSLPPVPLKDDRPRGNRGRRFSITRFMRLKLKRKVAEPGLRFDTADVFVFDMQGKLLQEKTFEVAVSIPAAEPPPAAAAPPVAPAAPDPPMPAAAPPEQPAAPDPPTPTEAPAPAANATGNSILAIPSNSEQEPQGGQEE
ncbi:MAG: hypothetical protein QNI97_12730 [Desulfobacterales bacterium]|nr:hypothetical protein [Desulfobacterales bacterium]